MQFYHEMPTKTIECEPEEFNEIKKMSLLATIQFQNSLMDTQLFNQSDSSDDQDHIELERAQD